MRMFNILEQGILLASICQYHSQEVLCRWPASDSILPSFSPGQASGAEIWPLRYRLI